MLAATRSKLFWTGVLLLVGLVGLTGPWRPQQAHAHPLGNFTINRYSRIELSPDQILVRYIVDMAEIPAFQEHGSIDQDGNGQIDAAEKSAYLERSVANLRPNLVLKINGTAPELHAVSSDLSFPPGQGGLDTERIVVDFVAPMPTGWQQAAQHVQFQDTNYDDRIGWREIVVRALDGVRLTSSSVPSQDISDELRAYPKDGISNPLKVRGATFELAVAGPATAAGNSAAPAVLTGPPARATRGNPDTTLARYAQLITKERLSAGVIVIALLAAMGFGALHALSPGHGKTIVGAYLVGTRGTWRHALLLALTVTATHTSSVYALGFVTLYLSAYIVPEQLYPWLSIASGGLIFTMGLTLFASRLHASRLPADAWAWLRRRLSIAPVPRLALAAEAAHASSRGHDDGEARYGHASAVLPQSAPAMHSHGIGPAHSHMPAGQSGVSWRSLIGLGIFGGLLPCPSAIVVMLSAIALHRVAFGLVLILAFSAGLALVLTAIGFILVYAGAISRRLPIVRAAAARLGGGGGYPAFIVRAFPASSAAAVVIAGLVVTMHGLSQQGIL